METAAFQPGLGTTTEPEHVANPREPITIATGNPDVVLRQFMPEDAEILFSTVHAERNMPGTVEFGGHITRACRTLEDTQQRIVSAGGNEGNRELILGIWNKGQLAGEVLLEPNPHNPGIDLIEYWVSDKHRGQGLAQLAARSASSYSLYQRGAEKVFAGINSRNVVSRRVVQRLGFVVKPAPWQNWYELDRERLADSNPKQ